jgi:hypothetical protein
MISPVIDLSTFITENGPREPIDFEIGMRRLYHKSGSGLAELPQQAVIRTDTDRAIAVIPDRCPLHLHQPVMESVLSAAERLKLGPMPRGVYLDRDGARMRAVIAFPAFAEAVHPTDTVCPCLMIQNSYDRIGRIHIYAGALRCAAKTFAVGGGGVFAQESMRFGFGDIPGQELEREIHQAFHAFPAIVRAYRIWADRALDEEGMECILEGLPPTTTMCIWRRIAEERAGSVLDGYWAAVWHATRCTPAVSSAFRLLEHINAGFQRVFRSR